MVHRVLDEPTPLSYQSQLGTSVINGDILSSLFGGQQDLRTHWSSCLFV